MAPKGSIPKAKVVKRAAQPLPAALSQYIESEKELDAAVLAVDTELKYGQVSLCLPCLPAPF